MRHWDRFKYQQVLRNTEKIIYDIATLGIGIGKHEFEVNNGIVAKYVDHRMSFIHTPNHGHLMIAFIKEVKRVPLTEIYKIKPDISDEEMEKIAQYGSAFYDYYGIMRNYVNDLFQRDTVTLLYFLTTRPPIILPIRKKTASGFEKVIKSDSNFNPDPNEHFEGNNTQRCMVWGYFSHWFKYLAQMGPHWE